jgi:hypothetical protein
MHVIWHSLSADNFKICKVSRAACDALSGENMQLNQLGQFRNAILNQAQV